MLSFAHKWFGFSRFAALVALGCALVVSADAFGQPGAGRRGGGGGARGARPTGPRAPQPNTPPASAELEGSLPGFILGFTPAKSGNEELVGYLKIKPIEKNGRTLKLAVHRVEDVKLSLANRELSVEEAQDLFRKGLYCSVEWGVNRDGKDKSAKRELRTLKFDAIDVEGSIESIADDLIVLKAKPKSGDWPGTDNSASQNDKPPAMRKLKLRTIPEVTSFTNPNDEALDIADFEPEQSVDATIIFNRSAEGMIVNLRRPGPRTAPQAAQTRTAPPPTQQGGRGKPRAGG
ncbi:MAG: hypothetical protein HBSAPP02_09340 [Phycisphaerae bacterium]|nr:MAG: hypothetical protein HRU71_12745 [Planctomycetia bacterium]RIK69668.1 MAG: hypothetical protein DCC66_07860 [Planctomycetota bacterium]GJQ25902.1 MAG: hypothetical protein HBSAPP02_09340 [Phycisphaerae bacterium]